MSHNNYPLRRKIAAATLAAVGVLSLEACSSDVATPNSIPQSIEPTAPALPTAGESTVNADPMTKARFDFNETAKKTGLRVLADITNPRSNSNKYAGSYQGNGQYTTTNPDAASIPRIAAWYLDNERSITISSSVTTVRPKFDSLTMQFNITGAIAARFSSDLAAHKELGATDFMEALSSPETNVNFVNLIDDSDVHHEISLANMDPSGLSVTRFDGSETKKPLDETSVNLFVPGFDRRMIFTESKLTSNF
jgi:hypothetical protein